VWRPGATPPVLALDFERARVRTRVPWRARHRALAKLDRYCAGASASSRMRFLVAYASGDRDAARAAWRAIEASAVWLMRHDVRRWCRIGARAGRRFEAFDGELAGARAHGLVRRGVDLEALRTALAAPRPSGWRAVPLVGGSAREARRCFGVALALHQRGLALRPDALLSGARGMHVVFEQPTDVATLPAHPDAKPRAAWTVAVDRLLALGSFDVRASRDAFVRSAAGDRVWLVDPSVLAIGAAPSSAGRRAEARRLVARWCAADQVDEPR